jgi:hypothetical protein
VQITWHWPTIRGQVLQQSPIRRGLQCRDPSRDSVAVTLLAIITRHPSAWRFWNADRNYSRPRIVSTAVRYNAAHSSEFCLTEALSCLLWSSGQGSCLQIQRSRIDSRSHQILWEVVGLERGPLCLVSTTEELLGRKSSGSGVEIREYGRRDPSRWPRGTLYPQKVGINVAENRRSLGRRSSLAGSGHGVRLFLVVFFTSITNLELQFYDGIRQDECNIGLHDLLASRCIYSNGSHTPWFFNFFSVPNPCSRTRLWCLLSVFVIQD